MSTSEPRFQFDQDAVAQAKSAVGAVMPDVATLTRMANEFFRALPNQPVNAGDYSLAGASAPASYTAAIPGAEMRQPQFGASEPSAPALPSADKIPSEADLARLAGSGAPTESPAEFAGFTGTPTLSPLSVDAPAATSSVPSQAAIAQSAVPLASASPFSLPLPDFDLAFPNFETSLPTIPPLAALGTEDFAQESRNAFSPLYFLEGAGALSQPIASTSHPATQQTSQPAQGFAPSLSPS